LTSDPVTQRDVAIVGMAARFAEADDVAQFFANLSAGRDSVRELSAQRKQRTSLPLHDDYQLCGYIEDIDSFDHAFFGISKGEANTMAPQHRLLLQSAYHAVENAGYGPAALQGMRGSVYLGDTKVMYDELAATLEPTMVMGSHVSAMAGRLSRLFGLRGPAAMIDSSCSSSMTALYLAVNDLLLGEADVALVGCASLNIFADRLTGELDIGIRSPDGKTRCFSAEAAGTGSGEAVATIVLKRLDRAVRDGDVVHAVIKGVAVNNVGGRSSQLTAPDAAAEAEVIERAWEKSAIDPRTISFVEAHGTATRLGDPIEIEALDAAFARVTSDKRFCALSSAKSNLGHTWSASGLVGLVKAVLSLRHHVLFPNVHSETLSPLIDFANSAVVVTRELTPWQPACGVRRAGVSSFGVMGTNGHAVLEEAPPREPVAEAAARTYWLPVSAKSAASLAANVAALRRWIAERPEAALADVQRTLVGGRGHYAHRFCAAVGDRAGLLAALDAGAPTAAAHADELVLVVSGDCTASAELTAALRSEHPRFDELYAACEQAGDPADSRAASFAFRYAFVGLLRHVGLRFAHVVGEGSGKLVLAAGSGRVPLAEALRQTCRDSDEAGDVGARVDRLLGRFPGQRVCFVEAGPLAGVSRAIAERESLGHRVAAVPDRAGSLAHLLRDLYLEGVSWTWESAAGPGRRIELPSYAFERTRCWLEDVRSPAAAPATSAPPAADAAPAIRPADTLGAVSAVWQDVLALETLAPDASFFGLGGDSISGLQVVNRLGSMFDVELNELTIFDYETPLDLAAHIDTLRCAEPDAQPAAATSREERLDASPAQLSIWLASQFDGGSVAFNLTRAFRLAGRVDEHALRKAVAALAARHDALRASFAFDDERLVQRIAPADERAERLEAVDRDEPAPDDARLAEISRSFASRPFDLGRGPLLRVQLVRFADLRALLTISTHHIVADGWSLDVLVRDLAELYAAHAQDGVPALTPIDSGYRDHQLAEQRRAADGRERAARYWLERFADLPPQLDLPTRADAAATAFRGSYRTYTLPDGLWPRIKQLSREEGGTAFGCVMSIFAALFAQYSERGEVVLGTSVAGRGQQSEQLVGMLVRTVPLRVTVDPDASLRSLYATVRSTLRDAMANVEYPYEELVRELQRRSISSAPNLFEVLIELEQFTGTGQRPEEGLARTGLEVTPLEVTLQTSVFPLNIMLSEHDDGLAAVVRFDTRLFDERTIDQLWAAFADLVATLLDAPGERMDSLPLLGPREQQRVRTLGHRTLDFDASLTIPRAIRQLAATRPNQVCLSAADGRRTYAQLDARANQLARVLVRRGVGPGELVALVMDRSLLTVESILAVWKCGAAYLPVDAAHPPAFVRLMLESSGARVVALDPRQAAPELVEQLRADHTILAVTDETGADESRDDLGTAIEPQALAYVIYTSGSTGAPKGAMVEHLGMLNHLHAKVADLALSERSVVAQNASSSFDISVWQMFAGLFAGGRTVVYEQALQLDPVRFAERLVEDGITVLEVVPSYLDTLLDAWQRLERPVRLDALEYLMVTGEAAHPRLVNRWLGMFPRVAVVNAYGPTEASDDVTHHVVTEPVQTASVPLGRPIPNTLVYVLDERARVVPQGVKGEICVSGICVGRGYLNAPEQTARVFTPDPFDPQRRMYRTGDGGRWSATGTLQYLGRSDSQVKVRGFRLDLGEIERRLAEAPGVKAAAVVVPTGARDRLCAYVVLRPGATPQQCRAHLAQELPGYMIPADIVELGELPLTANGKLDRVALRRREAPRPAPRSAAVAVPRTATEQALSDVWEEVLGRAVDRDERFFDVGGNSLRAIQVLSRIRARLGAEVTLEQLFARPSIASLAQLVAGAEAEHEDALPSLGGPGSYEIAPTQQLLLRIEQVPSQRDAFARNDLYDVHGPLDAQLLEQSFAAVARRHETLRTTFETDAERPLQVVHPPGALAPAFAVHELRGDDDVAAFVRGRIRQPFDVAREPLVRADLLRTGDERYALLVSMHQLVSDGRSAQVLHDDLLTAYEELAAGRDPSQLAPVAQYKDVAYWRAARLTPERIDAHRRFWRAELEGASSLVALATDRPRPAIAALHGERIHLDVCEELTAGIAALARDCAVTEFVVARTALALALCAATGSTDVTVGTYTRGRNRTDVEDGIGFYIHTVPLRLRLSPDDDVRSLLAAAQRRALRAFEHEEHPYEWTMRELGWERGPDRAPLFDVMVAMDDLEDEPDTARTLRLEPRSLPRRSKEADLLVVFGRRARDIVLMVTYDTHLFGPERAQRFALSLRDVLADMVADRPIDAILARARS
jgi:amino acid adenylation domain-containing protein